MREARIYHPASGVYRCLSKVRPEAAPLDDREKDRLASMLKLGADIFQIPLLAYCVYDDCFDTLIRVPGEMRQPKRDWLIERLLAFHRKKFRDRLAIDTAGNIPEQAWDRELKKWSAVAGNPSDYFKALKQNFSLWRNERRQAKGSLWKGRFTMIPVEDNPDVLLSLITEVGASPMLAGSPLESGYPFCSLAELREDRGQWKKKLLTETGLSARQPLLSQLEMQARSLRFAAFKRLPKQYGRVDLEALNKENRKRIDSSLSGANLEKQQKQLARQYARLTRGHPGEQHDSILADLDPELLQWVRKQRTRKRAGRMGKQLEALLNKHQFQWEPTWARATQSGPGPRPGLWNQRLNELKMFLKTHDRMPNRSISSEYTLARWVTTQRYYRKKGRLTKDRLAQLEEIGI